ncbi:MAG: transposase InsO family protein [Candidatus Azotimanducaceae bacterium]|jgi:transposase InsO family protein
MNVFDTRYMDLVETKLNAIINKEATVTDVAEELNVTRQTIYTWKARFERFGIDGLIKPRKQRTGVPHNKTSDEITQLVINTAQEYWHDGVETLSDHLERLYNVRIDQTTVYRILKREGIRYGEHHPRTTKRWKKQLYSHQVPGLELQMDTKYPYGYKQGKVIYTIIDDASRWVYAWSYSTANQENTLDFIEKVRHHAPFLIQKIRTDNGKEFVANSVRQCLFDHGIEHRTNTPYCPEENGKIERFHRTLNEKCIRTSMRPSDSLETMQYKIVLFLQYYNWIKKHRGLGMEGMTPVQKLTDCMKKGGSVNLTLQCYKH